MPLRASRSIGLPWGSVHLLDQAMLKLSEIQDRARGLLNPVSRPIRWGLKLGLLGAVVVLCLYPNPLMLVENLGRWRNLDALADGGHPALDSMAEDLGPELCDAASDEEALRIVEGYVYGRLEYAWDWDTWGVADYVPTIDEMMEVGQEDCDGHAILAAALLKRLGYEARVVSDLSHVWVWTPGGEAMSPGAPSSGSTFVQSDDSGTRLDWGAVFAWRGLMIDWPRNLGYGIAVFPAVREAIMLVAVWMMLVGQRPRPRAEVIAAAGLICGWLMMRWLCADWNGPTSVAGAWAGIGLVGVGLAVGSGAERVLVRLWPSQDR